MSTQFINSTSVCSATALLMGLLTQSLSADQPIGTGSVQLPAVAVVRLDGNKASNLQGVAARFERLAGPELQELQMLQQLEDLLFGGNAIGDIFAGPESDTNSPFNTAGDPDTLAGRIPGASGDGGRPPAPWERETFVGNDPNNLTPGEPDNQGGPGGVGVSSRESRHTEGSDKFGRTSHVSYDEDANPPTHDSDSTDENGTTTRKRVYNREEGGTRVVITEERANGDFRQDGTDNDEEGNPERRVLFSRSETPKGDSLVKYNEITFLPNGWTRRHEASGSGWTGMRWRIPHIVPGHDSQPNERGGGEA